jgi:cupin 2 domain-containing protein
MPGLFDELPQRPMPEELVQTLHEARGVRIERIVSFGHATGWYDQDEDEWVAVLAGTGELEFADGSRREMRPGDYEWLPAHRRHRVVGTATDQPTVWLAVFLGSSGPAAGG